MTEARMVPNGKTDWAVVLPSFEEMMGLVIDSGIVGMRIATFDQIISDLMPKVNAPEIAVELLKEAEAHGSRLEFQSYADPFHEIYEYRYGLWEKRLLAGRHIHCMTTFGTPDGPNAMQLLDQILSLASSQMGE